MATATCRQCDETSPWLPSGEAATRWLVHHINHNHSTRPSPIEYEQGRLLHEIHRDYAGRDKFGRLGYPKTDQ